MNLMELSRELNRPVAALQEEIANTFGVIILSEFNTVQEAVVAHFLGEKQKAAPRVEKQAPAVPAAQRPKEPTEMEQLLAELDDIRYPDRAYTKKLLRYCLDNQYLIFIDTCSLLNEHFMDFYQGYLAQKGRAKSPLYVPYVVVEELKRIVLDRRKDRALIDKAVAILQFIGQETEKNNIVQVGDEGDKRRNERGEKVIHADRLIIEKLIFFRNDARSSLFITQDFDATVDALKQNDWKSTKSNALILVKKITRGGALVNNTKNTVNPPLPIDNP